MNSTSGQVQNQGVTRRRFVGTAVAMAAAPVAALAGELNDMSIVDVTLEDLKALCLDMLALRSWWAHYGEAIRQVDRQAAGSIHDVFVSGAGTASVLARRAQLNMPDCSAGSYAWGTTAQIISFAKAGAA